MDFPDSRRSNVGWLSQVGPRLRTLWMAKMLGSMLGMAAFFVVYFWLLNHRFFPITIVPFTVLDRLIDFRPEAFPLYVSLWIYVLLAPALLKSRRELESYGVAVVVLSLIGFGVFLLWPTAVPKSGIDWARHPSLSFLQAVDASGNALPSLHVAFAVFTAVWLERLLREMGAGVCVRALNGLWCLGIVYSTMAIRQHVALDALAGAILGMGITALHLRIIRDFPVDGTGALKVQPH
jgi:membrane-associated phospholipid phosphatase